MEQNTNNQSGREPEVNMATKEQSFYKLDINKTKTVQFISFELIWPLEFGTLTQNNKTLF